MGMRRVANTGPMQDYHSSYNSRDHGKTPTELNGVLSTLINTISNANVSADTGGGESEHALSCLKTNEPNT